MFQPSNLSTDSGNQIFPEENESIPNQNANDFHPLIDEGMGTTNNGYIELYSFRNLLISSI